MPTAQLSQRPQLSRRQFLEATALAAGAIALPVRAFADSSAGLTEAIAKSPLVYVSPLKSDGEESRCHGEVWFVSDGADLLVVTDRERWRAAAVGKGLDRARMWVGDFGVWKNASGAFRGAPSCVARAAIEKDAAAHARALTAFGTKYPSAWGEWGPRFQKGLASGERVLLRYTPLS
jgi:hypothetical protein